MFRSTAIQCTIAILAATACVHPAFGGKKTYVGAKVANDQLVTLDQIDHQLWDTLLRKYVDTNGFVNYAGLKSSATDRARLDQYIRLLSKANLQSPAKREAKLAYWINAYNAVTIHGMLREYPTKSIRNHTSRFGGYNIWHDYQLVVGEQAYSLDQMEHKILRKMNEPRIHFAIVCASIGCPRLLNEAYTPQQIEKQLERNTKDFFSRRQNFQHDVAKRQFRLSAILSWFDDDFGNNRAAQLRTIAKWLPTSAAQQAALQNTVRVKYLGYDWNINEQPNTVKTAQRR